MLLLFLPPSPKNTANLLLRIKSSTYFSISGVRSEVLTTLLRGCYTVLISKSVPVFWRKVMSPKYL